MSSVFIFANPIAGRGKGSLYARRIQQSLVRRGCTVTAKLSPPSQIKDKDLPGLKNADAVIVIGGDGTLRGVAHFLLHHCEKRKCPPMLVVPLGTANLMGKHLGIKWKPQTLGRDVAEALEQRRLQQIDAAILQSAGDTAEEQLLLLVAGVGIDARVVHELAKIRRGPITYASYAIPTAMALTRYRFPAIEVKVDSQTIFTQRGIALVGNVREYGTGFSVLPHARPDDGLLDVCAMPCRNMAELVKLFVLAAAGKHLSCRGVVYTTGRKIEITSAQPVEVQADGDAAGWTPVTIEIMHEKLQFILPAVPKAS